MTTKKNENPISQQLRELKQYAAQLEERLEALRNLHDVVIKPEYRNSNTSSYGLAMGVDAALRIMDNKRPKAFPPYEPHIVEPKPKIIMPH